MIAPRHAVRVVFRAFAGLALAQASGCSRETSPAPADTPKASARAAARFEQPPGVTPKTLNVVWFLIDTLRADRTSLYGYPKATTPYMDHLAAECVVFDNAQAPAPWTLPSVPSMLTSTFSCEHGVNVDGQKVPKELLTLPELLRGVGYHTAQFYANGYAGPTTDLQRGYDLSQRERYTDGAIIQEWLKQRPAASPFFLYIHNVEPHQPHKLPLRAGREFGKVRKQAPQRLSALINRYRSLVRADWSAGRKLGETDTTEEQDKLLARLNKWLPEHLALYDAGVKLADERFGSVVDTLREAGLLDECVLVLVADHGEEFAEHGAYLHSQSVYEELTHVPLMIRFPHGEFGGRRIREVVSLVDVMPTLCDYLGRPQLLTQARGKSLMPLIRGERESDNLSIQVTTIRINTKRYYKPWEANRGDINVAMRQGSWKGIYNVSLDALELYDLDADPREQNNLAANPACADRAATFLATAREWYGQCVAAHLDAGAGGLEGMDEEQLKQLAALGYIDLPAADKADREPGEGDPNEGARKAQP